MDAFPYRRARASASVTIGISSANTRPRRRCSSSLTNPPFILPSPARGEVVALAVTAKESGIAKHRLWTAEITTFIRGDFLSPCGRRQRGGELFSASQLDFLQQLQPPLPAFHSRFLIRFAGIGCFARSHETVARAFVGDWLDRLARLLHQFDRLGNGRADASVVPSVEAVHRTMNAGDVFFLVRPAPIEDEGGFDVLVVRGEAKRLRTSPTKPGYRHLTVGRGQLGNVRRHGIQIGRDLIGREFGNRFPCFVRPAEVIRTTALRSHSRQHPATATLPLAAGSLATY